MVVFLTFLCDIQEIPIADLPEQISFEQGDVWISINSLFKIYRDILNGLFGIQLNNLYFFAGSG